MYVSAALGRIQGRQRFSAYAAYYQGTDRCRSRDSGSRSLSISCNVPRMRRLQAHDRAHRAGEVRMKVKDTVFIFGLVFIGIPLIGLATVFIEMLRGAL
tara:strand:+ start:916 stop:1212 length:297 start_codon:yes stop_codon:yes gene_type:complete